MKITKCQIELIHTFAKILNVYTSFHQMAKYGYQGNHILQDSIGLEI